MQTFWFEQRPAAWESTLPEEIQGRKEGRGRTLYLRRQEACTGTKGERLLRQTPDHHSPAMFEKTRRYTNAKVQKDQKKAKGTEEQRNLPRGQGGRIIRTDVGESLVLVGRSESPTLGAGKVRRGAAK